MTGKWLSKSQRAWVVVYLYCLALWSLLVLDYGLVEGTLVLLLAVALGGLGVALVNWWIDKGDNNEE